MFLSSYIVKRIRGVSYRAAAWMMYMLLVKGSPVFSQYVTINVDSVRKEMAQVRTDSTRSRLYGVLGWQLRFSNQPEALRLADAMLRISAPGKDYLRLAEAYRIKGFVKAVNQDMQGCLDMYALGIENARKAKSHYYLASFYLLTGGLYQDKGDYDMGIPYYLDGLKEAEESGDPEMIAFAANNTAEIYSDAGRNIDVILPYYHMALDQADRTQNWQFAGMTWSNIAKDLLAAGRISEAGEAVRQSVACLQRKPERGYVYATVITDLGEVLTGLRHYAEAESYLTYAAVILDSLGLTDNRLITLAALAKLYVQSGRMQKAQQAGDTLLRQASLYHSKRYLRDAHKVLSDVARSNGNSMQALKHYQEYKRWDDSLFSENKEKSIANAEARWKVNQKARENELLRQSNIRLGNSNLVALITAGILLVTGICLVIAYRILRRKNRELQQQKSIIEQQSVEKDTLLREIHHRVKNNLQIVSGLLNLQAGTVDDPKARESLMLSQKRIKAISLIHQNLYGFDRLAHIRLTDYIKQLYTGLRMLYNGGNIDMYCTAEPEDISLNLEMAVPLGLILNEAITNALKYAFTDRSTGEIRISCTRAEGMYTISISDNGIGLPEHFDPQQSPTLGFRLIRELTRQLRGSFSYRSGNGTEITIRLNT